MEMILVEVEISVRDCITSGLLTENEARHISLEQIAEALSGSFAIAFFSHHEQCGRFTVIQRAFLERFIRRRNEMILCLPAKKPRNRAEQIVYAIARAWQPQVMAHVAKYFAPQEGEPH